MANPSPGAPSDRQSEAAEHRAPARRIRGAARSGKTSALAAAAATAGGGSGGRVVSVAASSAAGPTFFDLAIEIGDRHDRPRRLLSRHEQVTLVAQLLADDDPRSWPTLADHLGDSDFAVEVASTACAYQASFLGLEELRTHANAVDEMDRWDEVAAFADRYLDVLDDMRATDWAGALVRASLLLRVPSVRAAEIADLAAVVVDDWETATFATNRLLSQMAGPATSTLLTVAGNPSTGLAGTTGGNPSHLEHFIRRFAPAESIELDTHGRIRPVATVVRPDDLAAAVVAELERGTPSTDMAVIVRHPTDVGAIATALRAGGVAAAPESATTRWERWSPGPAGSVAVVAVETVASRRWPVVAVAGCTGRPLHAVPARWFDLELLGGPDLATPAQRQARADADNDAAFELATSRADERLILAVGDDESGFSLPSLPGK